MIIGYKPAGGTLTLCPTPLGNLGDLSPRVRAALEGADVLACEDTRTTLALLATLGIPTPELQALHDHNERERVPRMLDRLRRGASVVLVSEAGMPVVSDPGFLLVQAAVAEGLPVTVLPGPSAVTAAVAASGIPAERFAFVGFPPRKDGERGGFFTEFVALTMPIVIYESPRRVVSTLKVAVEVLGERACCDAVNLSKQGERFLRGTISEVIAQLEAEGEVKGEHTVVIGRGDGGEALRWRKACELCDALVEAGLSAGRIRDLVVDAYAVSRRDIYQRALGKD